MLSRRRAAGGGGGGVGGRLGADGAVGRVADELLLSLSGGVGGRAVAGRL
jgi:hypothetical protein